MEKIVFDMKEAKRKFYEISSRCNNKNTTNYKYYGGRGIECKITPEEIMRLWVRDRGDLLEKPSIDRIDNNGNYDLFNCRFIELSENVSRTRRVRKIPVQAIVESEVLDKRCTICKIPLEKKTTWQKFCSPYCRLKHWRASK